MTVDVDVDVVTLCAAAATADGRANDLAADEAELAVGAAAGGAATAHVPVDDEDSEVLAALLSSSGWLPMLINGCQ